MKSNPRIYQKSITLPSLMKIFVKSIFVYVILAVFLTVFCVIIGFRTSDNIGNGFIYVSLCLVLFGTLTLFGNTVPAQLTKLSLPKYRPLSTEPHKETEIDGSGPSNRGKKLFLTSLICGAFLFITGLILRAF